MLRGKRGEANVTTTSRSPEAERILQTLESLFPPIASAPHDRELSRDLIDSLMPLIPSSANITHALQAYAQRVGAKWEHIIKEYGVDAEEYRLASQPEGLLLGYLLEQDRIRLLTH